MIEGAVYVDPDAEFLHLGECAVPRWDRQDHRAFKPFIHEHGVRRVMFYQDLMHVKKFVYQHRAGQIDPVNYKVDVVFSDGETQEWLFSPHVGWPMVDGVQTNSEYWEEIFK